MTPFASATSITRVRDGGYRAALDDSWNLRPLPQGGIITAIALRAMEDALGNESQRLRTMNTVFVGQVAHGELEIEVVVLRRGRSMSHLRAEVRNPGAAAGHIVTAVFGASRDGFEFTALRRPDVPAPDDCPSFRDPRPAEAPEYEPMPFWARRVEGRTAFGVPHWETVANRTAEQTIWYRLDDPPWIDDGARVDPLSIVMLVDTMPGAIGQLLGPTERDWFGPSVDLTVHLLGDCHSPWILSHNTARWAGD
ncbi:MAG TPA: thioesterase family protein, partial [Ilumatobacteraceae bacterium]